MCVTLFTKRAEGEGGRRKGERRRAKGITTARKRAHPYTTQIYGNSRVTAPKASYVKGGNLLDTKIPTG